MTANACHPLSINVTLLNALLRKGWEDRADRKLSVMLGVAGRPSRRGQPDGTHAHTNPRPGGAVAADPAGHRRGPRGQGGQKSVADVAMAAGVPGTGGVPGRTEA